MEIKDLNFGKEGGRKRKGQMFMIGMLLLAVFLLGLFIVWKPLDYSAAGTELVAKGLERDLNEFQHALNSIVSSEKYNAEKKLRDYMNFQEFSSSLQNKETRSYFLAGIFYNETLKVRIGNFMGSDLNSVNLSIYGTDKSVSSISDNEIRTFQFFSLPEKYKVSFNASFG